MLTRRDGAALLTSLAMLAATADAASPIDRLRWSHRVLLVFSPERGDTRALRLDGVLEEQRCQLGQRDMVVVRLPAAGQARVGDEPLADDVAAVLRQRFQVPPGGFRVVLLGKDGGEKYRRDAVPEMSGVFALIDSMPMRREEMRAQGGLPCGS